MKRHLTYAELRQQCNRLKVPLERLTVDLVIVGTRGLGYVFYNTFSGSFFGRTYKGVSFASSESRRELWFHQLMKFFYVEE